MCSNWVSGIPKVQKVEDVIWVTEEEHNTIKIIQTIKKKKTKKYKCTKSSKAEAYENEFGLSVGLTFNKSREFLLNPNV